MKKILLVLFITVVAKAFAQKDIKPSDQFEVKIDDVIITNHMGEQRSTAKNMKGVLLKDLLDKLEFDAESPKVLSEFYLTIIATDNYKVVFSWNELSNTETGNHVYVIMSPTDFKTGRRNVKGVRQIIVGRS